MHSLKETNLNRIDFQLVCELLLSNLLPVTRKFTEILLGISEQTRLILVNIVIVTDFSWNTAPLLCVSASQRGAGGAGGRGGVGL